MTYLRIQLYCTKFSTDQYRQSVPMRQLLYNVDRYARVHQDRQIVLIRDRASPYAQAPASSSAKFKLMPAKITVDCTPVTGLQAVASASHAVTRRSYGMHATISLLIRRTAGRASRAVCTAVPRPPLHSDQQLSESSGDQRQ